ncbi:MAG TPA: YqaA family protein [Candidatus Hydrogenedentes bacterium]|nr:YqaA family protein [Candidatus Hydrogenedentota bacterium]HNT87913.1 YqaA family protein [Candidatus Hydrogenedentota bacterium]
MFIVMRRAYDWVLSWAETPYGAIALAVLSFAEASFFPIPPDVLLIALCISVREKAMWYAGVCAVASLFGGILGYLIGWGFWGATDQFFYTYVFSEAKFAAVQAYYQQYDFWIVFIAAFTPIPYKIITIAAGVCEINVAMFLIASLVGRSARFFLVAGLIYWLGSPIKAFIDRWFNALTVAFVILLVAGFGALRYFEKHEEPDAPTELDTPAVQIEAPEATPSV